MIPGVGGPGVSSDELIKVGALFLAGVLLLLFGLRLADQRKVEAIIRSAIIIVTIQLLVFFVWRLTANAVG